MSAAPPCPGCGAPGAVWLESATAAEIAAAWAAQAHVAEVRDAPTVHADVAADLGSARASFLACGACGLEFADPLRGWSAGRYPAERYGLAFDHEMALGWLAGRPPLRLLELGCAEGAFLAQVEARGHQAVGVDFNPTAVAEARARGLDARRGEAAGLAPLLAGDAPFQAVAMFQLIEHLSDPAALFSELEALCAPGALLLLGCPSTRRYTRFTRHPERLGSSDFWDWPPQHTLRWSEAALRGFLTRRGWVVSAVRHEPFHPLAAAAHLTALRGEDAGWRGHPLRRRAETARALGELGLLRLRRGLSGLRMAACARWP